MEEVEIQNIYRDTQTRFTAVSPDSPTVSAVAVNPAETVTFMVHEPHVLHIISLFRVGFHFNLIGAS